MGVLSHFPINCSTKEDTVQRKRELSVLLDRLFGTLSLDEFQRLTGHLEF